MKWYLHGLRQSGDFAGRARRKEFWMFLMFNIIITFLISIIGSIIGYMGVLVFLYNVAVLIPFLSLTVRRLHDTGRSGWCWLLSICPYIAAIVSVLFGLAGWSLPIIVISLIGVIVFFFFMAENGISEQNQYGDNPKLSDA